MGTVKVTQVDKDFRVRAVYAHLHVPSRQRKLAPNVWRQWCTCNASRDVHGLKAGAWMRRTTPGTETIARMRAVLVKVQWQGRTHDNIPCCPCCQAIAPMDGGDGVHFPGCELDFALRRSKR